MYDFHLSRTQYLNLHILFVRVSQSLPRLHLSISLTQTRTDARTHTIAVELFHLKSVSLSLQLTLRWAVNLGPRLGVDVTGAGAGTIYPAEVRCACKIHAKEWLIAVWHNEKKKKKILNASPAFGTMISAVILLCRLFLKSFFVWINCAHAVF